jgi:hypothetical protein
MTSQPHRKEDGGPDWHKQKHKTLFKKQLKAKKFRVLAQVVECLPSKSEALSFNPLKRKKKNQILPRQLNI